MLKWLICFAVLACSAPALAQEGCATEAESTATSTCVVMRRGEARGVWFSLEVADALRREHLEVPELRLQVERFEALDGISTERISLYQESLRLRAEALALAQTQLEEALEREARARAEAGAWYREPVLWFALGVVLAGAAAVAAAAAF
jgi:hypothetical protein